MAILQQRHSTQFVLLSADGNILGMLVKNSDYEKHWEFTMAGSCVVNRFNHPASCCAWLNEAQGLCCDLKFRQ